LFPADIAARPAVDRTASDPIAGDAIAAAAPAIDAAALAIDAAALAGG